MINEVLNKEYKKIDVLTILNTDPSILNRSFIDFFRKKGLYERNYSKIHRMAFVKGKDYDDWRYSKNEGRSFELYNKIKVKDEDEVYFIQIGFDQSTAIIRVKENKYGTKKKNYSFSVAGMSIEKFINRVWDKIQGKENDKDEVNSTKDWNNILSALKKRYKTIGIRGSMSKGNKNNVHFSFFPDLFGKVFGHLSESDKEMVIKILNSSGLNSDDKGWQVKEAYQEVKKSAAFVKMRMKALGYYFTEWESGYSQDYISMNFDKEKPEEEIDIEKLNVYCDKMMENLITIEVYKRNIVKKLFDPKTKLDWDKRK